MTMSLLARWANVVSGRSREIAVHRPSTGESWSFGDLDRCSDATPTGSGGWVFPAGNGVGFVVEVLRGWKSGCVVCPLEANQPRPTYPRPPEGVVHLKTTSASTGMARHVMFDADQLAADADNIVSTMGLRAEVPNLGAISLAHSYGFSNLVLPLLLHGIRLVLVDSALPEAVRAAMKLGPNVCIPAVPALWKAWFESGILGAGIHLGISAGAPLPTDLEHQIFERHGLKIHNFYGSTECGGIAYDRTDSPRRSPGCVGTPLDRVGVKIGESGCLEVSGPAVGRGYWPEASDVMEDGIFRTSDLAEICLEGIFLRGRAGDVINVAGRKLHPETVEQALWSHPGVEGCLVFGVPDPDRTERVVAVVHEKPGTTRETLIQHLVGRIAGWQMPREWWLTHELSPDARGKTSRKLWRDRFLNQRLVVGT